MSTFARCQSLSQREGLSLHKLIYYQMQLKSLTESLFTISQNDKMTERCRVSLVQMGQLSKVRRFELSHKLISNFGASQVGLSSSANSASAAIRPSNH